METGRYHEFFSNHLELNPTSQQFQFKAFCPFHENKSTPALSVNTEKGVWTCFGECNTSGGISDFKHRLGYSNSSTPVSDYLSIVTDCNAKITSAHVEYLRNRGIVVSSIQKFKLGSLGDKITYPYFDTDGRCIGYKAVSADKKKDTFFKVIPDSAHLFNIQAIRNASSNGRDTILLAEGEKDTLILDQAGYDVVGISGVKGFKKEYVNIFKEFKKVIVVFDNDEAGRSGAKRISELLGTKGFILKWQRHNSEDQYDVNDHYLAHRDCFKEIFDKELTENLMQYTSALIQSVPDRLPQFDIYLDGLQDKKLLGLDVPCFSELTRYMKGIRGMIGIGAPPKVGKSTLTVQIASEVAAQGYPVLYYDFENGYNRLILKILSRISQVHPDYIQLRNPEYEWKIRAAREQVVNMTKTFYVENDRRISEESILRQIEQAKIQSGRDRILIVVDSLQKLPMNLTTRREGIDNWIRFFEAVRDQENATLILISELSRSGYDNCGINSWKESGDLEYSFDHMMQLKKKNPDDPQGTELILNMIASRELESGEIATYRSIRPYWYFKESEKGFF